MYAVVIRKISEFLLKNAHYVYQKHILIEARQRTLCKVLRVSSGEYSMNKKMVMAYGKW